MRRVERESLLKSFVIFFLSMGLLIGVIYSINYSKDIDKLDERLFSEMRICSFDLECPKYKIDFVLTQDREFYRPYKSNGALEGYFPIPNTLQNSMKIYYPKESYEKETEKIFLNAVKSFALAMVVVALLALLFSWYTLSPLRNALYLTQEFIKDILHDFNTPLSTLRLNASMLSKEFGENKKIVRIQTGVQTMLNLQENLRAYLQNTALQKEEFEIKELLKERVELLQLTYKDITFKIDMPQKIIVTNRDAFTRILDNILSNAAKYNKENGSVSIFMNDEKSVLCIRDTGKGIENPKKVFDRFYKEQERGLGIGLHIVQKLTKELGMRISLQSEADVGTRVELELE